MEATTTQYLLIRVRMNIDTAAAGADDPVEADDALSELDYSITSNWPHITVLDTEVVSQGDGEFFRNVM